MHILYIGNHLGFEGKYLSVAQTLLPHLPNDLHFHLVSHKRNKLLRLAEMLQALFFRAAKYNLVIIDVYSTTAFYYALICGLICRVKRIKYICVLHGGDLPRRLEQNPYLSRFLFGDAVKLLAPSLYLQQYFNLKNYEVDVIPNPIDLSMYPFRQRRILRPCLLWVRAFDATYNPQMAIHVLEKLLKTYPAACLCMVGPDKDGSMQGCLDLAKQLGVADQVQMMGLLSKTEWINLAADYDIFINTTNFDNTPITVLEAMALGLPVVSTNAGGIPYLISNNENGILVNKNDVDGMSAAIINLVSNPDYVENLSTTARHDVEKLDVRIIGKQWKEVLKEFFV